MIYQPYVYRWTNIITGMYYIGSHTARGSYPGDSYICSSKIVKPLIIANPTQWIKSFLYIGTTKEEVVCKETEYLKRCDARNDPLSYNQHNGDGRFIVKFNSPEARIKMSIAKKGKSIPWNKGKQMPEEGVRKMANSLKGREPWNKGKSKKVNK
jgi:hypothetical protein